MSELIEKMLQEFDSGNMDAVNQILDQIDEMEGYKSTYKWREQLWMIWKLQDIPVILEKFWKI